MTHPSPERGTVTIDLSGLNVEWLTAYAKRANRSARGPMSQVVCRVAQALVAQQEGAKK